MAAAAAAAAARQGVGSSHSKRARAAGVVQEGCRLLMHYHRRLAAAA